LLAVVYASLVLFWHLFGFGFGPLANGIIGGLAQKWQLHLNCMYFGAAGQ
jgi:hypothetical protein